ncbi:hypothetical protein GWK36_10965 [Caldichromatium japonicum]|uniref:Uncharacterized protein n=1 Tax=Caldichromatium japonicum TaxID=2699430 RepID=A0A6G7VEL4_9GAMM|nr:hypothetical protein [Caldichromatium japonicum]QIK38414.1 hypothetical protein GWK36_10965 [Caldichromatium japonicum]
MTPPFLLRAKMLLCCALLPVVLAACASNPSRSSIPTGAPPAQAPIDIANLPRLLLPGADPAEVKALAMGAARARGWSILPSEAGDGRLIVGRPADPETLYQVAPQMAQVPGSNLEVTTFFNETAEGLEVAMRADLVIPASGGGLPTRIDYTDAFSPALMQSLEALRKRWIQDRERLARAAPPPEGWRSAWDESADPIAPQTERPQRGAIGSNSQPATLVATTAANASAADTQPQTRPATPLAASVPLPRYDRQAAASSRPQVPATATSSGPARPTQVAAVSQSKPPAANPRAVPVINANRPASSATAAQTRQRVPQAPAASAMRPTPSATPATRTTTPATPAARPGPMTVAGKRSAQTTQAVRPATPAAASTTRPAQTPAPPAVRSTASTTAAANRTPPAKAEQYAKQRGCRAGGAQLIESRRDGEVYRVPCQGSDSLLVHCRSDSCKSLL